jgi:hypothetical protein
MNLSRGQLWLIGIGLIGANAISLHTNLRRYLTGLDENQVSLNFEIEWWWVQRPSPDAVLWLSPNYVWLAGSLAFGLFLFSLWKLRFELGLVTESGASKVSQQQDSGKEISQQFPAPAKPS